MNVRKLLVPAALVCAVLILCSCVSVRKTKPDVTVTSEVSETEPDESTGAKSDTTDSTDMNENTSAPETEETHNDTSAAPAPATQPAANTEPSNSSEPLSGAQYPTVLTYHLIYDEPFTQFTNLFVPTADFESQLQNLNSAGYKYLFADEFGEVSEKSVILTFDDGYEDNYTNMFPLLKKYNARATIFMIAYKVDTKGYLTTAQIKEMAESGLVQFGSHTCSHYDLRGLDSATLRAELGDSKAYLSAVTGQEINAVCYPAGGYNDAVLNMASEYYSFGYTTKPGHYSGEGFIELPRMAVQRGTTGQGILWLVD